MHRRKELKGTFAEAVYFIAEGVGCIYNKRQPSFTLDLAVDSSWYRLY